jgi:hypothetical protein
MVLLMNFAHLMKFVFPFPLYIKFHSYECKYNNSVNWFIAVHYWHLCSISVLIFAGKFRGIYNILYRKFQNNVDDI